MPACRRLTCANQHQSCNTNICNVEPEVVLPEPRHGTNDGSRGIYMASPSKSNTIYHVEGLAGEREEPIPVPECYARVTEGIPPVNAQWNTNICMKHVYVCI